MKTFWLVRTFLEDFMEQNLLEILKKVPTIIQICSISYWKLTTVAMNKNLLYSHKIWSYPFFGSYIYWTLHTMVKINKWSIRYLSHTCDLNLKNQGFFKRPYYYMFFIKNEGGFLHKISVLFTKKIPLLGCWILRVYCPLQAIVQKWASI